MSLEDRLKALYVIVGLMTLVMVVSFGLIAHRLGQINNSIGNIYYQLDRQDTKSREITEYLWP